MTTPPLKKTTGNPNGYSETNLVSREQLLDAMLTASRALVAIAARSLASVDSDVTLPQYRTLVILYHQGTSSVIEVANELNVNPSTATRMIDRLCSKKLVSRHISADDRRRLTLELTKSGRRLVSHVLEERESRLSAILDNIPSDMWPALYAALSVIDDTKTMSPGTMIELT